MPRHSSLPPYELRAVAANMLLRLQQQQHEVREGVAPQEGTTNVLVHAL